MSTPFPYTTLSRSRRGLGDLAVDIPPCRVQHEPLDRANGELGFEPLGLRFGRVDERCRRGAGAVAHGNGGLQVLVGHIIDREVQSDAAIPERSEEHTSELQSLMRISYAVFCLKKKKI